jgi:hypothetical protein
LAFIETQCAAPGFQQGQTPSWQERANNWRGVTNLAWGAKRLISVKILGSKQGEIRVKTMVLAGAVIVASVFPASAFQQATWDGGVSLECAVVKTSEGYKKDADPIYKIVVELRTMVTHR